MSNLTTLKQLNKSNLPLITLVSGEDVGLYHQFKERLLQQIDFDASDLAYAYFDLSETSFEMAAMDLESLPFFSDEKIVILDYLQDLTTDKKSFLDDKELKLLENYIANPLETTRLLIFAPGKLDGKRRIVKLLKRDSLVLEATPLKEAEFKTYFLQEANQMGLTFEAGAFEHLLYKSQYDFGQMNHNLIFLADYTQSDRAIEQRDIEQAIPKTLQDNIFDLTQLTLGNKIDEALELVKDLRLQGEEDIKLIAVMVGQLRFFLQIRLLTLQGRGELQLVSDLSQYLGRKVNPYHVKFALKDSRPYPVQQLKFSLKTLIETDFQIKMGLYDKEFLFDLALLKIAGFKD